MTKLADPAESIPQTLRAMKIGDTVFFPKGRIDTIKVLASRIGAIDGAMYVTRQKPKGVKVWRLE